jgi:hypothetical protein
MMIFLIVCFKIYIYWQIIPAKASTLKRRTDQAEEKDLVLVKEKVVLRKVSVERELPAHVFESTYCSRNEASVYFPKLPRGWMDTGLIITPSLSEKVIFDSCVV